MATWEEGTLVYPGFNFLRHLLGHLVSSKWLDFPLPSLTLAGPRLPRGVASPTSRSLCPSMAHGEEEASAMRGQTDTCPGLVKSPDPQGRGGGKKLQGSKQPLQTQLQHQGREKQVGQRGKGG